MMEGKSGQQSLVVVLALAVGSLLGVRGMAAAPVSGPLESRGLRQVGSLFLLTTETDVHKKVTEIKTLRKQLSDAESRQRGYGTSQDYQQAVKNIGNRISQLKQEIQLANQQMSRMPRGRRGFANSVVTEQYYEIQNYRNQLQTELNETTAYLNQFKSQPFDPKTKSKLDAAVNELQQTYDQTLVDLRTVIDSAQQSYGKLAADDNVKRTLRLLARDAKIAPKLGPSPEFSAAVKLLEKLERETVRSDTRDTQTKTARRSRAS